MCIALGDSRCDLLFLFSELAEIAGGLDVEPEPGALFEKLAEFEGHFRGYAAATEDDVVDASRADAKGSCEGVLGNAHWFEVVLK